MSKTKVAPVKVEMLPRLELCGATLLARLAKHLLAGIFQKPASTNFWSDSKVVLDWLKSHPSRWPTFVANRVSEISSTFPNAVWRHVPSKDNPADCASRGMTPQELARFDLWWRGPAWLIYSSSEWPTQQDSAQEQIQSLSTFESTSDSPTEDGLLSSLEKYSNFSKIVRVIAYCLRWKRTHPREAPQPLLGISAHEYSQAKNSLFKLIQAQYFSSEISCISTGKQLSPRSMLARLSPFIDDHGLIRVGGRLQNTTLPFAERHPIILPGRCYFVKLLVEETHRLSLHGGVQLMKSLLNRTCWIIRGSRLVTAVYRKCITCTRFGATPMQQQMAPLPVDRLAPGRPFSIIGLDYAGPFPILFSKGRGAKSTKGYVAIFICVIVKAVHIEVVSDLTSESFMAAYSRFSARRGLSSTIYSDNGTTFKGADAELKRLFNQSSMFSKEVFSHLAARGTDWKFIPPRAPHFGGLWEAAVRSFKYHLRRVVGSTNFTFEEFATLTAKIEACLNSRPVCPLSNDANAPSLLRQGTSSLGPHCLRIRSQYLIWLRRRRTTLDGSS